MRMCMLRSRQRCPSLGCAPSFGAASMARARPRRAGKHFTQRPWRASGLPEVGRVPAAFTIPTWTFDA
eukprot:14354428-Alexandrium_andersonii.AAC.1